MIFYQNNQNFSIVGTPKEQQGFGLYFKSFAQDAFTPNPIGKLATSTAPFFAYDNNSPSINICIEGKAIELTNKQQGFLATYRFAIFKNHIQMAKELKEGASQVLTREQQDVLLPKVPELLCDFRTFVRVNRVND